MYKLKMASFRDHVSRGQQDGWIFVSPFSVREALVLTKNLLVGWSTFLSLLGGRKSLFNF